jgi:hypothetical protein
MISSQPNQTGRSVCERERVGKQKEGQEGRVLSQQGTTKSSIRRIAVRELVVKRNYVKVTREKRVNYRQQYRTGTCTVLRDSRGALNKFTARVAECWFETN